MTILAVAIVAVLVVALDAFVYLSLRDRLEDNLHDVLVARADLSVELARQLPPRDLVQRLTSIGVPAVLRMPSGEELVADPATRRFVELPPGQQATIDPDSSGTLQRALPDGGTITVLASRSGVDGTLRRVLLLELVGSLVAVALSVVVLARMSRVVLRPLDRIVEIARRIGSGRDGGRLNPDRTDTELGRMAAAFDEMLDELERALEESRRAETRSRRFLADAAHQLRTPIAGIRASVETLLRDPDHRDRDRLLSNLASESARVGRLVGSLLRMAQLDRGSVVVREHVDVASLVRVEAERAREIAPGLDVRVDITSTDGTSADLETASIREAVANLLDNARRYAAARIEVDLTVTDSHLVLRVADDGPGVAEADRERVFERFVTLDDRGGSGLGLPIARGVARAHGGDLTYEQGGFVLRLPRSASSTVAGDPP